MIDELVRRMSDEIKRLQAELCQRDAAISHHLEMIERMAEERHLGHGAIESAFWNCSRPACQAAAKYLREQPKHFDCRAEVARLRAALLELENGWDPARK